MHEGIRSRRVVLDRLPGMVVPHPDRVHVRTHALATPKRPSSNLREGLARPAPRDDRDRRITSVVEVESDGLSTALRPRTPEAGGSRENECGTSIVLHNLELSALGDGGLMDVPAENELYTRGREFLEHDVAAADGTLAGGTPGRRCKMVVQRDGS
jgi:hypothetical protein